VTRTDIRFPYGFDGRGRTATAPYLRHVLDMLEQLLLTHPGERVNRPDFGGGLAHQVFEPNAPERAVALELALSAAVDTWLGDIVDLRRLTVEARDSQLRVELDYVVRATGEVVSEVVEVEPS
jgi:phage baseplate assembly protein W